MNRRESCGMGKWNPYSTQNKSGRALATATYNKLN
jgi:hypothetical protein